MTAREADMLEKQVELEQALTNRDAIIAVRDERLAALSSELDETQKLLANANSQVSALEKLQGTTAGEVINVERAMEVLRFDLKQSFEQSKALKAELATLQADLEAAHVAYAALEATASSDVEAAVLIQNELIEKAAEIEALLEERAGLARELNAVTTTAERLLDDLRDSESVRSELISELSSLRSAAEVAAAQNSDLSKNLSAEITKRTEAEANLAATSAELAQAKSSFEDGLVILSELRSALDELQISADETTVSLAERDEEILAITTQLDAAREVAATKTSQLELGQSQFEELQTGFQKQRIILMLRQSKYERASLEVETLKGQVAELTAQLEALQVELDAALADLDGPEEKVGE